MAKCKFKIHGTELSLSLLNADENERVEKARAVAIAAANAAAADEGKSEAEKIRALCGGIRTCFDDIFGFGMGSRVCGAQDDLDACIDAYMALSEEIKRDGEASAGAFAKRAAKFAGAAKTAGVEGKARGAAGAQGVAGTAQQRTAGAEPLDEAATDAGKSGAAGAELLAQAADA